MAADVAFTFDPAPIVAGVDSINRRMNAMTKSFGASAKDLTKSVTRGILKATAVVGGLIAMFKGVRSAVRENMPEIGQAFEIVKNTFFKQFFWPIRKELMPLLQRLLDWTRDNRARFVKWGQTIVNIFKTVITIAKQMVSWARTMFEQITASFGRLFGDQVNSLQEALDLLSFKASAVAIFLGMIAQQVIDWFSEIVDKWGTPLVDLFSGLVVQSGLIGAAWELLKSAIDGIIAVGGGFLSGLAERAKDVGKNLVGIFNNIKAIWEAWTTPTAGGNSLVTVAKTLGGLVGDIFATVTSIIKAFTGGFLEGARALMDPLQDIVDAMRAIWNTVFGGEGLEHFFRNLGRWVGEGLTGAFQLLADVLKAVDKTIEKIKEFLAGEYDLKITFRSIGEQLFPGFFKDWDTIGPLEKIMRVIQLGLPLGDARQVEGGQGGIPNVELPSPRDPSDPNLWDKFLNLFRSEENKVGTSTVEVNVNGMTLNVTEGNAEAAGANFGAGLGGAFRDQVDSERRRLGE